MGLRAKLPLSKNAQSIDELYAESLEYYGDDLANFENTPLQNKKDEIPPENLGRKKRGGQNGENWANEKEREILTLLARCRYATTKQIVALYFQDSQHSRTAFRRANLLLNQIKNRQLINHLERRIGGVRAGQAVSFGTSR